jgi:hypothetical protein
MFLRKYKNVLQTNVSKLAEHGSLLIKSLIYAGSQFQLAERERESVCVCVCERERERVRVSETERERARAHVCECVYPQL